MADQEFLASFAVEIDEGGVSRLQTVLSENRDLANEVAAAFEAATAAIQEYQKAALGGSIPPGKGTGIPEARTTRKRPPATWKTGSTGAAATREKFRAC